MKSGEELQKERQALIKSRKDALEARIEELLKTNNGYLNPNRGEIYYPHPDLYSNLKIPTDGMLLSEIFHEKGYIMSHELDGNVNQFYSIKGYFLHLRAKQK